MKLYFENDRDLFMNWASAIAINAASKASDLIMGVYRKNDFQIEYKGANDPVTIADKMANEEICSVLHEANRSFGILTEEKIDDPENLKNSKSLMKSLNSWDTAEYCWIIDPIDGTKDFIEKTGNFGVHIGLIENGVPIIGVVSYPAHYTMFYAMKGMGAFRFKEGQRERISVSEETDIRKMRSLTSEKTTDEKLNKMVTSLKLTYPQKIGGIGLKIINVAHGDADLYLVFNSTPSLWDICAPQIILEEAGGIITDLKGKTINYRNKKIKLKTGLIAVNRNAHASVIETIKNII
jgi:3'(2'), 5'-bisphosphate nucleotidase